MNEPIEIYVQTVITESFRKNIIPDHYVTITGIKIKFGSKKCIDDIQCRIADAIRIRQCYPARSDGKIYYSGILRILRRELRAAQKILNNLPV